MSFFLLLALATPTLSRYLDSTVPSTTIVTATATQLSENDILRVTEAPSLNKRAKTISPNICGWYSGEEFDDGWSDAEHPSYTCFWNTDEHLVGTDFPLPTTCLEHATSGDNLSLKCDDDFPYCLTFQYGNDYSAFLCHSERDVTWTMAPTWKGMDNPIAFPIYSGSNGISTGTQYPSGYTSTATDDDPASSSTSQDSSSESLTSKTDSSSPSSSTSSQAVPTTAESSSSSSPPVGAIVGGVIGGLAVVGIVVCVIVFLMIRRNKRNKNPTVDTSRPTTPEPERSLPNYGGPDSKPKLRETEPHPHPSQEPEPQPQTTGPPQQSMEEPSPPYHELWTPRPGPDSTQQNARLAGGRQIYEAP